MFPARKGAEHRRGLGHRAGLAEGDAVEIDDGVRSDDHRGYLAARHGGGFCRGVQRCQLARTMPGTVSFIDAARPNHNVQSEGSE
jgi:hypothetical protein